MERPNWKFCEAWEILQFASIGEVNIGNIFVKLFFFIIIIVKVLDKGTCGVYLEFSAFSNGYNTGCITDKFLIRVIMFLLCFAHVDWGGLIYGYPYYLYTITITTYD